jgi:hypothetical protein
VKALLRLYPRAWRARYRDEMLAVLEEHGTGWRTRLDLLRGALDAQLSLRRRGRPTPQITGGIPMDAPTDNSAPSQRMGRIEITPTSLVVHMKGFDRVLAVICGLSGGLKGRLEVPLEHVTRVDASAPEAHHRVWKGWTVAALNLPGVVTVGRVVHLFGDHRGEWTFWDMHDPDKVIAIHLHDEFYTKLVIQVDDPARVTAEITWAVSSGGAARGLNPALAHG